jgi:YidC/Oxa1 family membrane protein insertase
MPSRACALRAAPRAAVRRVAGGVPTLTARRCAPAPGRLAAPRRAPVRAAASLDGLSASTAAAEGVVRAGASLVAQLADATSDEAAAAAAAATLAANKTGFLGGIANALEGALEAIDGVLTGAHVPYSYGFSIIALTLLVKVVTFPLSKKQIESTTAMQALQPRVKDLQARGGARARGGPGRHRNHKKRLRTFFVASALPALRCACTHARTHAPSRSRAPHARTTLALR